MILPAILPDEIFCSLLVRICRLHGGSDFRDVLVQLLGQSNVPSFIDASIDVPRFCQLTNYAYGGAGAILHQMTWHGAQLKIGEIDGQTFNSMAIGESQLALGSITFPDAAVVGYCPSCRELDLERYGVTYWHRLHQLPIVFYCPTHAVPLVKISIKRHRLHDAFPVPSDFESDMRIQGQTYSLNPNFWRGVAAMVWDLLQAGDAPDQDLVFSILADELRLRNGRRQLSESYIKSLPEQLAAQAFEDGTCFASRECQIFLKRITRSIDKSASEMPLGRVVLLYWLFGSWSAVLERCQWIGVLGSESEILARNATSTSFDPKKKHRQVCSAYIKEHPGCLRLDFLRAEYRSFRWLLRNDQIWLDQHLPVPYCRVKQLCLF